MPPVIMDNVHFYHLNCFCRLYRVPVCTQNQRINYKKFSILEIY